MLGIAMSLSCLFPLDCQRFAAGNSKDYTRQGFGLGESAELRGFEAKITENKNAGLRKVSPEFRSCHGEPAIFGAIHHRLTGFRYIDRLQVATREEPPP